MPEPDGPRKAIPLGHHAAMPDADATPTPTPPSVPPRPDLRRRVLAGEPAIGLFLNLGSLVAADVVARTGYDWALVDLEHGLASDPGVLAQLIAIQSTPTAAIVRVLSAERLRVGRALDLGADGVMIPRLGTVDAVRETVSWMRYPPAGVRGVAAGTRGGGYGSVPHAAIRTIDQRILGVFQVESGSAVDAADQLATIDGVDVLFVGPADLSHDLGIPGEFGHPTFLAALDRVAAVAAAHGKAAGILLRDASDVPAYRARGYGFLGIGSDSGLVVRNAREQLAEARAGLG
jgi:2-dehydro-3-deoxyglucarate aldolase/4-hydroxy-2-oxoheptanedioate aldolase